ncbi:MAG: hypothetical protein VR73_01545 [Gammaproteobacteria bacterium BRH_c0]|nr:MAG: hypothetical protein VR73_01545 [Gammaproteobacteria bacterium BRH_c0]
MSGIQCSTAAQTRQRVEAVIASFDNPNHKRMLEVWLKHWWGEVMYDLPAVMATVTDDIAYRWYGTDQIGDGMDQQSADLARTMYQSMFDAKLMPGGPFDNEHWAFGAKGLTLEALFIGLFPGSMLKGKSAQPDPEQRYLVQFPMMVSTPFDCDNWLMKAEIMYAGAPLNIVPADAQTVQRLLGHNL